MALDELELKRIDRTVGSLCRKLSPPEHAEKLRTVYEVQGHTVTMYEDRPPWDGVGEWTHRGLARFRYVRSSGLWSLYWMRADLRWHRYDPAPSTADLASLVAVVADDEYGAFLG
jgi:heme A synthase